MPNFRRKLTEEQRDEIIEKFIASCVDKNAKRYTQTELAAEYGVTPGRVSQILHSSEDLRRLVNRMSAEALMARAMAMKAAPLAMEETIKDALAERDDKFRYINQNACRDILDRAGIRERTEEKQAITITFGAEIPLGMPDHTGDEQESAEAPD